MVITEKLGNIKECDVTGYQPDTLILQWHETNKRILNKQTDSGERIQLRFLNKDPQFTDGDIIYMQDEQLIYIKIEACECIVLQPNSMHEMANAAYEIGNKHLPLFFENNELLTPYDGPLFRVLINNKFSVFKAERQLLYPLRTSVAPHEGHSSSLFEKIMKFTAPNE